MNSLYIVTIDDDGNPLHPLPFDVYFRFEKAPDVITDEWLKSKNVMRLVMDLPYDPETQLLYNSAPYIKDGVAYGVLVVNKNELEK